MKSVFFAAHTDDEMICAGTLHRLTREGHELHVVCFSPAAIEMDRTGTAKSFNVVQQEWVKSMELIGVPANRRTLKCFMPSAELARYGQEIADCAFEVCERLRPDLAITLSPEDENPAHAVVGRETERVMRGRVATVLRCHFPWNFGLGRPNVYAKLAKSDLEAKLAVIEAYQSQKFRYDYKGMLMSYAVADGMSVKTGAAERFELVRAML